MNQTAIPSKRSGRPLRSKVGRALAARRQEFSLSAALLSEYKKMPKACRVSGIYSEGAKFRVVVYWPDRRSIWCQSQEETEAVKAKLEDLLRQI
jgi:hypothetical protein